MKYTSNAKTPTHFGQLQRLEATLLVLNHMSLACGKHFAIFVHQTMLFDHLWPYRQGRAPSWWGFFPEHWPIYKYNIASFRLSSEPSLTVAICWQWCLGKHGHSYNFSWRRLNAQASTWRKRRDSGRSKEPEEQFVSVSPGNALNHKPNVEGQGNTFKSVINSDGNWIANDNVGAYRHRSNFDKWCTLGIVFLFCYSL
jgi:hypothetical protein